MQAAALCSGGTVDEEFRRADIVVRGYLVSEVNAFSDEPTAAYRRSWGNGAPVVRYVIRIKEVMKGRPGPTVLMFTERNSGAFYVDIDKDYLLYLAYDRSGADRPTMARGSLHIPYACGQSKPWAEVKVDDLARLRLLSRKRR